jgi:uncharacterized protein YbcI
MKRRQSRIEAAISDEMMAFQHEFVGRGPDRIRTYAIEDLVIVRSFGVLTPAERQLSKSFEGRRIIKAMRQHVLEAGRSVLEGIVQKHTGATVVSVHSDISTKSGEWVDVFVLDRDVEEVQR